MNPEKLTKKFHPTVEKSTDETDVENPHEAVIALMKQLRTIALEHDDFEVMSDFMDAIADFDTELTNKYLKSELIQVPMYHSLISSGMAEGTEFENKIESEKKSAIETDIISFVNKKLSEIIS